MRISKSWLWTCGGIALLGLSGSCLDKPISNTGSAVLYAYDGSTNSVLAWNDVSPLYDNGSAGSPDRTITSSLLGNIGLGGMALDASSQRLFLVTATGGTVVCINRAGSQNGALSSTADIYAFTLNDSSTDATGGTFGQVSADPVNQMLYVTEATASKSQIWAIPYGQISSGAQIYGTTSGVIIGNTGLSGGTSDTGCTGVTAGSSGALYAFFSGGGSISNGTTYYTGPRLRKGGSTGFASNSQAIVGDTGVTQLGVYGCLAYDTGNDRLYAARHDTDSGLHPRLPGRARCDAFRACQSEDPGPWRPEGLAGRSPFWRDEHPLGVEGSFLGRFAEESHPLECLRGLGPAPGPGAGRE
jgi:hypothetical protein